MSMIHTVVLNYIAGGCSPEEVSSMFGYTIEEVDKIIKEDLERRTKRDNEKIASGENNVLR